MLLAMAHANNLTKKSIRLLILWVCLLPAGNLIAQSYFNKRINLSPIGYMDRMYSIIANTDGYLLGGHSFDFSLKTSILLSKISLGGIVVCTKTIGDSLTEHSLGYPGCFQRFNDSLLYSVGSRRIWYGNTPWVCGRLICYNNNLDTIWSKYFMDQGTKDTSYFFYNFNKTISNGYIITGSEYPYPNPSHILLQRIDQYGTTIWRKTFGSGANSFYHGYSVTSTTDGGYAIGGYKFVVGEFGDPLVFKTDSVGNEEWVLKFGGEFEDNKAMVCPAHDGTIICGTVLATSMVNPDLANGRINIIKIDNAGNVLWNRLYGADRMDNFLLNIRPTPDGGYIASGQAISTVPYWVGWLFKIDENGDSLWYREYAFLNQEDVLQQIDDVIPTSDNGFFACGYIRDLSIINDVDTWILKVDSLGCEAPGECWVGINEPAPPEPLTVAEGELSIRPNPATTETRITWQGEAKLLEVLNANGVRVWQCKLPPEQTQFRLNTLAWPHGLYMLRLFIKDGQAITAKMMKL